MFICSECGKKYEKMPKYCDCGNDIFEETGISDDFDDIENAPDFRDDDLDFGVSASAKSRILPPKTYSPAAIAIFSLCIILSVAVLFFIGNPKKEQSSDSKEAKETVVSTDIPSIDTFWDNTVAKTEQKVEQPQEPLENKIIDMMPKFVQQILPSNEPTQKQEQKPKVTDNKQSVKTTKTVVNNQTPQTKTPAKTVVPQTGKTTAQLSVATKDLTNRIKNNIQFTNNTSTQTQTQTKQATPVQTVQPSAPAPVPVKTVNTQNIPTTSSQNKQIQTNQQTAAVAQTAQTVQTPVTPVKSQAEIKKELNTYKSSLRNTIGKKIDFTKVIGDGDCTLTFKINSNGKLISKAFTKQSSNITLNDAAYAALNSTTSFNPPPEGYKGETLTLHIKFYNGNFEISLN